MSWTPAGAQYSRNIRWVLPQCCNVPGIEGTFSEHFKGKYFLKNSRSKSCFCVKSDLTITNVDLLANSSNHKAMFPEYSKNIPRIFVSKILQGYPRNIIAVLWKYFYEVKKFKKLLCGLSCENFNIGSLLSSNVFLNCIFI